ncbi:MAG: ABC transporter permease subunit, partial [Planctomycetota bacterium]
YPAVDLSAGEKERGTFETLLSSPASRDEIAIGQLLTVMIFSFATCLLNLLSVGITSFFVVAGTGGAGSLSPLGALELPPLQSLIWLILAMLPTAALFSALSLAAA